MRGQIVKRGETYLVRIPLGRDANGKRLYHNKTIHGTKKEAETYRTKTLREMDLGIRVANSHETLHDYMARWFRDVIVNDVRARTLRDYEALAKRHILPRLGHFKLSQLTPEKVQTAYAAMKDAGLSTRTIAYAHSVLHNALDHAVRRHFIGLNPTKDAARPKHQVREMKSMTAEQASQLLELAAGTRFEALWNLLLLGGLRPAEALGLKWSDIGADAITIQRSLVRLSGQGWEFTAPKTCKSRRTVAMPGETMAFLRAHKAAQNAIRLSTGAHWEDHDLVFCTDSGRPLEWRVVSRRYLRPLLAKAGLAHLRPYDLRHSCASLLLAEGENPKVVSERLGHAKVAFTLDVYGHVLPGQQQRAADALGKLLYRSHRGA